MAIIAVAIVGIIPNWISISREKPTHEVQDFTLSELRDNFNSGCVVDDFFKDYCNCAFDVLVANTGKDTIIKESLKAELNGYFSAYYEAEIETAAMACIDYLLE